MYFLNFCSRIFFTISLKKKLAIEYNARAPIEIDMTEMTVPIHLPNKIPEKIKTIRFFNKFINTCSNCIPNKEVRK